MGSPAIRAKGRGSDQDAVALTRSLLGFDTVNPPGRERDCARHLGAMLEGWGFGVAYHEFAEGRTSVIARAGGADSRPPLCLTGHIDTVPLGARAWSRDPFAGETDGDRLYGRGSSDMKAGVAAILLAARKLAKKLPGTPGIVIVLTAAEEGGCIGSEHLARTQLLGKAGAMIVGTFEGGNTVNSVPDAASFGVDIRTVPGMDHAALRAKLQALLGNEAELEVFSDMNAVWTEPQEDWVRRVFEIAGRALGVRPEPRAQTYNTDAGNLLKVYKGAPTVVLGPGEPQQAHQTDEYCSMERIRQSVAIYEELIRDWCGI